MIIKDSADVYHCPECLVSFRFVVLHPSSVIKSKTPNLPVYCPTCGSFDCVKHNDHHKETHTMKFLKVLVLMLAIPVFAHGQDEKVTVDKNLLTKDQIQQIEAKAAQEKVERYGKWVGVGHEVGTAVNESLTAITTQANNFAETKVGKATMFVVIWKVIGHDLMGFLVGGLIPLFTIPLWIWSYRKFLPHRVLVSETFDPVKTTRLGRPLVTKRDYKIVNDVDDRNADNVHGYLIAHYVFFALIFVVSIWAMFS